jgi:hypothetical protein
MISKTVILARQSVETKYLRMTQAVLHHFERQP